MLIGILVAAARPRQRPPCIPVIGDGPVATEFDAVDAHPGPVAFRSEEHTSELQSLMRISYAVFCLKKKKKTIRNNHHIHSIISSITTTTHNTAYKQSKPKPRLY